MANKKKRIQRWLGLITASALLLQALGFHWLAHSAEAAALTAMSDSMSRHKTSTASDHNVKFKTPTGVDASGDTITITFAAGFNMGSVAVGDIDLEVDADCDGTYETSETLAATAAADTWGASVTGQVVTLTAPTDAATGEIAADSCVLVEIGQNAGGGTNQITNPAATGSTLIRIAGTFGDKGHLAAPIVDDDQVSISARVRSYITFDLDAPAGSGGTHTETTTPYSVDLQELSFDVITDEDTTDVTEIYLDLSTNAQDGAIVQIKSANGTNGLTSSITADFIPSSSVTLATDTLDGGYGIAGIENATATQGTLVPAAPFNVHGTTSGVGGLTTAFQTIFNTSSAPIINGDGEIAVRAVTGKGTEAAEDYTDTLTFRATGTF